MESITREAYAISVNLRGGSTPPSKKKRMQFTSRGGKKILHLTESILTFMVSSIFTLIMKNIFVLNLIGDINVFSLQT